MKYTDTMVTFSEVPDEITLCINISGCPNHCFNCHSQELWEDIGEVLDNDTIASLIEKNNGISCVGWMGGDADPAEVNRQAMFVKEKYPLLMTCWYSGKETLSPEIRIENWDYIKLGPYIEKCGGLDKETTNQRFYFVNEGELIDWTYKFWKHHDMEE